MKKHYIELNQILKNHSCAVASVTYQHGKYELLSNGSLVLTPIAVDGRQLLSDPCNSEDPSKSTYTRYVQSTWFKTYQVYVDSYHGRWTLQIYQFDGSKCNHYIWLISHQLCYQQ